AEGPAGMVQRRPPRRLIRLAWIGSLVRVLSDGGGWNGDGAAGWPAVVVVVGAVGGVGVGASAGGGGDGRVVLAGAAGAVRRAGRGFGASTVTCGIGTAGAVSGAVGGV